MAVDKTKLVNVEGLEEFGRVVKNYVDMHGSGTTIHDLVELTEGSKYINVDLNEEATRLVVSLDLTNLDTTPSDTDNLITSGGVYTALQGKLDSNRTAVSNVGGLVKPLTTPTATELVGISTGMEQERVKIGDGLSYDTNTKTLSATGGAGGTGGTKLYEHTLVASDDILIVITTKSTNYANKSIMEMWTDMIYPVSAFSFVSEVMTPLFARFIPTVSVTLYRIGSNGQIAESGFTGTDLITSDTVTPL